MTNNDILRNIRYILDYDDSKMAEIFSLAHYDVSRSEICNWLKKEYTPDFKELDDINGSFLAATN